MNEPSTQPEWSTLRHDADLKLDALQAVFTTHAFARHWHDYYVIGLVEAGAQTFACQRATYTTPRGGVILINPGEAHTGEAASSTGFAYRALYPTTEHLAPLMAELGHTDQLPLFRAARIDDPAITAELRALHGMLAGDEPPIAREARWLGFLATLVTRYSDARLRLPALGAEPRALAQARAYLEERYAERITLADLAAHVGLSPFHLLRVFRRSFGAPPHSYLESVRIRQAQRLIVGGMPLGEVAYAAGFSSQSHLTTRFRRIIGVTPGQYRAAS
jgi:AraC-like DNA-binding protein